jgi:hypothetical protein
MVGTELPSWAVRLRAERTSRLWSQKVTAVRLRNAADAATQVRLPAIETIQRYVRDYEAGRHLPGDLYAELYCRAFGLTREALFGMPPTVSPDAAPAGQAFPTEQDAASLMSWLDASNTSDETIGDFDQIRAALAESHTQLPPGPVLADVSDVHRQVQELLRSGHQRSRQTRELFRIDADLLSHASLLLGDMNRDAAASAISGAAALCAEEAGCSPAYALSAQAKSARWEGVRLGNRDGARQFSRSADLARAGFERSALAPIRVLLASQEASAAALLGDAARARRALRDADDAATRLPGADSGLSAWSCPRPRQALYAMSVAIRLRDADAALHAADEADAGWAAGEPWLYAVWSLIRIGSGIAHVMKGDLDAAAGQVDSVITLDPTLRIATITRYLADMDSLLRQRRYAGEPKALDLRQQIRAFTTAAAPAKKEER